MKRRMIWIATCFAALLAGIIAVRQFWLPGIPFDSELWKNEPMGVEEPVRQPMADRLIAQRTLRNMTRQEVIAMLGPPSARSEFSIEWDASYYLGAERGVFSIDDEWLVVYFDAEDRVSAYFIATD